MLWVGENSMINTYRFLVALLLLPIAGFIQADDGLKIELPRKENFHLFLLVGQSNMAGRGTDIKLGRGVADLEVLHVIAAEPNESARIDRQLYGRGARQGDPGSAQGIFSLEDEVVSRHAKKSTGYLKKRYANAKSDISSPLVRGVFRLSQINAERLALRQRKSVLKTDHWLDEQLGFTGGE